MRGGISASDVFGHWKHEKPLQGAAWRGFSFVLQAALKLAKRGEEACRSINADSVAELNAPSRG